jgi:hypothetical protein
MILTELQSWTAPAGYTYPHSMLWDAATSRFYAVHFSGARVDVYIFNPATGAFDIDTTADYIQAGDSVLTGGKIYIACRKVSNYCSAIIEYDPATGNFTERFVSARNRTGYCIETDGTYLYMYTQMMSPPSYFHKVKISDWSSAELALTDFDGGEGMTFDGTYCWIVNIDTPPFTAVCKVTVAGAMAFTTTLLTGFTKCTDDLADDGTYLYIPSEYQTAYCKFKKSDSSFTIESGLGDIPNISYGAFYIDTLVYFVYNASPGKIMQLKPATGVYNMVTLSTGLNAPNEMATDGVNLYATTYTSPMKIIKFEAVPMDTSSVKSDIMIAIGG